MCTSACDYSVYLQYTDARLKHGNAWSKENSTI